MVIRQVQFLPLDGVVGEVSVLDRVDGADRVWEVVPAYIRFQVLLVGLC